MSGPESPGDSALRRRRLGILGGTFDPPHDGHLALAAAAHKALALDAVLLVVAPVPPHKRTVAASFQDRLAMTRLLIRDADWLAVSDVEAHLQPPHYTVRTIAALRQTLAREGDTSELVLIVGADNLIDLPHWKDPRALVEACQVAAFSRPGFALQDAKIPDWLARRVMLIPGLDAHVSSSDLRAQLAAGAQPASIPDAVRQYIHERGIYRKDP